MSHDIGPQNPSERDRFLARMRFHQSWYRASQLGIGWGQNQQGKELGNILSPEDARKGLNFYSEAIATLAERCRLSNPEGIKQFRLERNLLSSQPMCFNLFGPMALRNEWRLRFVRALTGRSVTDVTRVEFEYAPEPKSDYLNDKTAFDIFIEYVGGDGRLGFIGIEAKLSEPFSPTRVRLDAAGKNYRRWLDAPGAPWKLNRHDSFETIAYNQLWRDHMLAFALKEAGPERYASGELFLVHHQDDRKTAQALARYRAVLKDTDSTLTDMPLDELLTRWRPIVDGTELQPWHTAIEQRYVNLSGSGADWDARE